MQELQFTVANSVKRLYQSEVGSGPVVRQCFVFNAGVAKRFDPRAEFATA